MYTSQTNQEQFTELLFNNVFGGVQDISNAYQVGELLDRYDLNWKVEKKVLQMDGKDTPFYGIQRQDTGTVFTTCKESYIPFQNTELAEMLIRMSEKTGFEIHNGGKFNAGAKLFFQLKSPNILKGIGENMDTVEGYLTGINSHDGTTSLKWGETNITISCKNTFYSALKKLKNSARHTASIHDKVENAIREILGLVEEEKNLFDTFIQLSEKRADKAIISKLVRNITDVDILDVKYKENNSTYAINRTNDLLGSIASEMKQKGDTLWGLFSGVTHYTNYKMPIPSRENARTESIYTGTGADINNTALQLILA
jgi:hypothetical protein